MQNPAFNDHTEQLDPRELALRQIQEEHERLGHRLYWFARFAWWFRLWGRPHRAQTTIREEAEALDETGFNQLLLRLSEALRVYRMLSPCVRFWRRLFNRDPYRSRDYQLVIYRGTQTYLSTKLDSKPLACSYSRNFLSLLFARQDKQTWYAQFNADDQHRQALKQRKEQEAAALKQEALEIAHLEQERREVALSKAIVEWATQEEIKVNALIQIAKANEPFAEQLPTHAIGRIIRAVAAACRFAKIALHAAFAAQLPCLNLASKTFVTGASPKLEKLRQKLKTEANSVVEAYNAFYKKFDATTWEGAHVNTRLNKITAKRAELATERMRQMTAQTQEMTRRNQESRRQADLAQAEAVRRLENRSLDLDRWEQEIATRRGQVKSYHNQEPLAWTPEDIFWMRIAILRDAVQAGVFHLLYRSAVFKSPASVFRTIFSGNPSDTQTLALRNKAIEAKSLKAQADAVIAQANTLSEQAKMIHEQATSIREPMERMRVRAKGMRAWAVAMRAWAESVRVQSKAARAEVQAQVQVEQQETNPRVQAARREANLSETRVFMMARDLDKQAGALDKEAAILEEYLATQPNNQGQAGAAAALPGQAPVGALQAGIFAPPPNPAAANDAAQQHAPAGNGNPNAGQQP